MIFRCHKSRTQYFQNGGEYFTDCAMRKGDYLDIYKRNSNCADYSDKCTSFWELLLSYAFSIFHLSVLRNICIISLIVFLFFVFVFFPRTDLTIDEVSHFISHKKFFYFTCPSRMHCTCHIWSKWTPWRIIISFSGSGPFDPSLRYLGYREVFSFFASPSYKKLPWAHHSLFNFQPPTNASFISVHSYLRLSVSLGNCKTTDFITSSVCEISLKVKPSFSRTKRTLCIKESWRERSLIGYDFLRFWQSRSWIRVKIYEI